ncbi:MAG: hypothetical protein IKI78_00455 [Clostridia bacterium]|nr:hypothetical protein [Clostridia bacterium]
MPCIKTTVSKEISENTRNNLIRKFGEAIALFPGKSETWLMLTFNDNVPMSMSGDAGEDCAFLEVSLFGSASDQAYDRMTAAITEIISEELGIAPGKTYVKYEEAGHWGWNGRNF